MQVFLRNEMAPDPNAGWGYDGQDFCFARFNGSMAMSSYSDDGLRQEYDYIGWVNLRQARRDELPSWAAEALERRYAEACQEATAPIPAPAPEVTERQAADERQREANRLAGERLTIGGVTEPRWVWREGVYCDLHLSAEDRAIVEREGLVVEEYPNGRSLVIDPHFVSCGE